MRTCLCDPLLQTIEAHFQGSEGGHCVLCVLKLGGQNHKRPGWGKRDAGSEGSSTIKQSKWRNVDRGKGASACVKCHAGTRDQR